MPINQRRAFLRFVRHECGELVADLAEAIEAPLRVVTHPGTPLVVAGRNGNSASDPCYRAPICPRGSSREGLAILEAHIESPRSERLVNALALEIARRFDDSYGRASIASQMRECEKEIDLLLRFRKSRRPDEQLVSTTQRLLEETAHHLDQRLLLLYLPRADILQGADLSETERAMIGALCSNHDIASSVYSQLAEASLSIRGNQVTHQTGEVRILEREVPYVALPLRVRAQMAGFVGIFRQPEAPDLVDPELRLLNCLAVEVSNTATTHELNRELHDMLFNTVRSLVAAIDAKDEYTRGHSERVYQLSTLVGERLGLTEEDQQTLTWAAMLHDIGKIAISGNILMKPDKLTSEEYDLVKTHSERGVQVLEPIPQLRPTLPAIRHHHERFDGRGYPDGLKGEEIPLFSRIIAVADTYDAIVSTRSYRKARSHEHAIAEIRRNAGTQFDPLIARTFLELAGEGAVESAA